MGGEWERWGVRKGGGGGGRREGGGLGLGAEEASTAWDRLTRSGESILLVQGQGEVFGVIALIDWSAMFSGFCFVPKNAKRGSRSLRALLFLFRCRKDVLVGCLGEGRSVEILVSPSSFLTALMARVRCRPGQEYDLMKKIGSGTGL